MRQLLAERRDAKGVLGELYEQRFFGPLLVCLHGQRLREGNHARGHVKVRGGGQPKSAPSTV
jgi:hypothetical protein